MQLPESKRKLIISPSVVRLLRPLEFGDGMFFVKFIIVNIIFTEIPLTLLHNDMPYELSYKCMDINVTTKLPPPVLDWNQLILDLWRNNYCYFQAYVMLTFSGHLRSHCIGTAKSYVA